MYDIITIGTATRDVFLTGKQFKVLKDKKHLEEIGMKTGEATCFALGSKTEVNEPVWTTGGGALNAAVTFSRFGMRTAAVFKVGEDRLGREVIETARSEKITPMVLKDKRTGTAYSTILVSPGGERTILLYRGASENFKKREISFSRFRTKCAYIVPSNISFVLMSELVKYLKDKRILIAINPSKHYLEIGKNKLRPLLSKIDVVIVNREEASRLTGVEYGNTRGIFKSFDELVPGIAVMTDGPDGAYVSDGRYLYTAGVFKEKRIADRTGAGDAFGSAFVAGLLLKNDIHYALRVASANATSVVEDFGAQTGILIRKDLNKKRFRYLDMGVEPL